MTCGVTALVIAPGVGDREELEDAADRLPGLGSEREVKVVSAEAVPEEAKRIAVLGFGEGFEEGDAVGVIAKNVRAVIAAVEGVVDQTVIDGAR
jgi:hypothetical protein